LSFLLVFVGFGAKIGFAPMHTWLPDAHSQAPSPVCAVLSGIKTSVPLYAVLRFLSIVLASPAARMGRWMIVIGLISVAIAAFLLLQVRDYKRMFAYSTVEHMGIILTAAGLATQASDFGAVLQMLNHSITKSLCFYVAGTILITMTTREIKSVRGLLRLSPFSGAMLLLCALAIAGAPPFPIFLSEFSILSAGVRGGHPVAVAMLASLIVIAFVGIMLQVNRMVFGRPDWPHDPVVVPRTCRVAVVLAAVPVVVLGIYIPAPVYSLLRLAAQQLGGH
jgi:hydrogenase-4 component F